VIAAGKCPRHVAVVETVDLRETGKECGALLVGGANGFAFPGHVLERPGNALVDLNGEPEEVHTHDSLRDLSPRTGPEETLEECLGTARWMRTRRLQELRKPGRALVIQVGDGREISQGICVESKRGIQFPVSPFCLGQEPAVSPEEPFIIHAQGPVAVARLRAADPVRVGRGESLELALPRSRRARIGKEVDPLSRGTPCGQHERDGDPE
jgi:hypothetical protein